MSELSPIATLHEHLKLIEREVEDTANEMDQLFRQRHKREEVTHLLKRLVNRCAPIAPSAIPSAPEWKDGPPNADKFKKYTAGQRLRYTDGSEVLVGHINELGGVCDCCRDYAEVVAYQEAAHVAK